jgi:hypothetical protein
MATKVNNLSATAYAKPHTMSGKPVTVEANPGKLPNRSKLDTVDATVGNISKSAGSETTKTAGTVTRGNGCATKGITARGPMA